MGITIEDINVLLTGFQWLRGHVVPELPERDPALWAMAQDKQKAKERLVKIPLTPDTAPSISRPESMIPLEDAPPEEVYRRLDPEYAKAEFEARRAWEKEITTVKKRLDLKFFSIKASLLQLTEFGDPLRAEYSYRKAIGGSPPRIVREVIQDLERIQAKLSRAQPPPVEKDLAGAEPQSSSGEAKKRQGKHPMPDVIEDAQQYIISRLPYLYELTPGLLADDKEACKKFKETFSLKVISKEIGRPESKICETPAYIDYVKPLTGWHGRPRREPKGYKNATPAVRNIEAKWNEDEQ